MATRDGTTLLTSVRAVVAVRRWRDAQQEEPDIGRMTREAFISPALLVEQTRVAGTKRPLHLLVLKPGQVVDLFADSAPHLVVLALDIDVIALNAATSGKTASFARRRLWLNAIELGGR